jgi:hypothetical protein
VIFRLAGGFHFLSHCAVQPPPMLSVVPRIRSAALEQIFAISACAASSSGVM